MDEIMKKAVMNASDDGYFIDEDTNNVYYRIPGVEEYFLRYDGRIFHYAPYCNPEPISRISDPLFETFEEAVAFLEFFGAQQDLMNWKPVNDGDVFFVNDLEDKSKTFAGLMKYDEVTRTYMTFDVMIVASELMKDTIRYQIMPRANWYSQSSEPMENRLTKVISGVSTAVLKPIKELTDMYFITGGSKRAMVQVSNTKSCISDNTVFRFTYHKVDNQCISCLGDYKFYTVNELMMALEIWGAKSPMYFTETVKKKDGTSFMQHFVRYFDNESQDSEHVLSIIMIDDINLPNKSPIQIYELIEE